ncbi:MAG: hypothetical protein AAF335_01420 [Bacteroidota bacterium]
MCKSKHLFLLIAAVTLGSKTTYAYPEDDQKTEKAVPFNFVWCDVKVL